MALAFDAATGVNLSAVLSVTFAHTVGAGGTNRLLYVVVAQWASLAADEIATVTYGGASLTLVGTSSASTGGDRVKVFRLIAPATGTNNVVCTTASSAQNGGRIYAISLTGGHQTTPEGTATTAVGSSTGPAVTQATAAGDWVIDGVSWDATGTPTMTMTASTGRTQRGNAVGNGEGGASSTHSSPSTSQAMGWTLSASRTWAEAAINVKAAAAGGITAYPASLLMGM